MIKIKFIDSTCDGGYTVPGYIPKYFEYVDHEDDADYLLYSHFELFRAKPHNKERNLGLIWESPSIMPQIYTIAPRLELNFKHIFTFKEDLLIRNPEIYKFVPAHGLWVGTEFGGIPPETIRKNRRASVLCSSKMWCEGHRIRHHVADICYGLGSIDCFGEKFGNRIDKVIDGIAPYFFHVAVENHIENNYFTEKILNCFACGTVPVYIGCPNIGSFFNEDGIIKLESTDQLQSLSELDYSARMNAIHDNFHRVKKYGCLEDWIYENYLIF